MQGPQHLGSPAGISALACCGRQANVASMCSSSADAAHADTRSSAPCPHAALGQIKAPASVAAAALVQCLAQRSAQAAEEAAAAAAAAEVPAAPTDVIISVSFTVAILALSIVTVGVRMPGSICSTPVMSWGAHLQKFISRLFEACACPPRCCTCPSAPSSTRGWRTRSARSTRLPRKPGAPLHVTPSWCMHPWPGIPFLGCLMGVINSEVGGMSPGSSGKLWGLGPRRRPSGNAQQRS